jgi:hypothetical protein
VSDQELNDLLKSFDNPNHCYQQRLVDAIRLLVKERDEARQMICRLHFTSAELQHDFAKAKGWDCFPQEDGKQS